jgi:hypothetical protein
LHIRVGRLAGEVNLQKLLDLTSASSPSSVDFPEDRQSVHNPNGDVAKMVLINVANDPHTAGFTALQAAIIIEVARAVTSTNWWGADDEGNVESLAAVEAFWTQEPLRIRGMVYDLRQTALPKS